MISFWQNCVNKVIQPPAEILWNFFSKIALWESAAVWLVVRTFVDALWTLGILHYPSSSVHLPRRINQMWNYDCHKILQWNNFRGINVNCTITRVYKFISIFYSMPFLISNFRSYLTVHLKKGKPHLLCPSQLNCSEDLRKKFKDMKSRLT